MGRAPYTVIPRGLPSVLIGALTVGLVMPTRSCPTCSAPSASSIGVAISFYGRFAVNIVGFWLMDTRGVRTLYMVTSDVPGRAVRAGRDVPRTGCSTIAYCTPFPSILQTPIDVISGQVDGHEAVATVGMQVVLAGRDVPAGRVLLNAGRRKLVVQGG